VYVAGFVGTDHLLAMVASHVEDWSRDLPAPVFVSVIPDPTVTSAR
jgi:hypothetical protein